MPAMQSAPVCMRSGSLLLLAAALPLFAPSTHAQRAPSSRITLETVGVGDPSGDVDMSTADPTTERMLRTMARQREELREKAIVEETNQLLDLAQQLKTAVDKTDKDRLSLSALHTAAQIEKLAKTVEKKMRSRD